MVHPQIVLLVLFAALKILCCKRLGLKPERGCYWCHPLFGNNGLVWLGWVSIWFQCCVVAFAARTLLPGTPSTFAEVEWLSLAAGATIIL